MRGGVTLRAGVLRRTVGFSGFGQLDFNPGRIRRAKRGTPSLPILLFLQRARRGILLVGLWWYARV